MCKEKFYGAVHEGLRTWVAAAHEDGWDVRDVRYGPPPEVRGRSASPVKKSKPAGAAGGADGKGGGGARKASREDTGVLPMLEIPRLDFVRPSSQGTASGSGRAAGPANDLGDGGGNRAGEAWLS